MLARIAMMEMTQSSSTKLNALRQRCRIFNIGNLGPGWPWVVTRRNSHRRRSGHGWPGLRGFERRADILGCGRWGPGGFNTGWKGRCARVVVNELIGAGEGTAEFGQVLLYQRDDLGGQPRPRRAAVARRAGRLGKPRLLRESREPAQSRPPAARGRVQAAPRPSRAEGTPGHRVHPQPGEARELGTIPGLNHMPAMPLVHRRFTLRSGTSTTNNRRTGGAEHLHGHPLLSRHYATALQMLGQGVQTRVFHSAFRQSAEHLGAATPTQFAR